MIALKHLELHVRYKTCAHALVLARTWHWRVKRINVLTLDAFIGSKLLAILDVLHVVISLKSA